MPRVHGVRTGRHLRLDLGARLRARRAEIEQAALDRIGAIADATEPSDPAYLTGLRTAVGTALDYGLEAIERGEESAPPIPAALLVQARVAARNRVNLDTVLRRYFAGYSLLIDFLIDEAQARGLLSQPALKSVLRAQATLFDRLLAAVSEEHARESIDGPFSSDQREAERVRRLIAGELVDTSAFAYDFRTCHLGIVASGVGGARILRTLAACVDRRLLLVEPDDQHVWGWLGGDRTPAKDGLEKALSSRRPEQVTLAIGEPGEGLAGWRLTHRQARAALPFARPSSGTIVHYADVAMLASCIRDDLLATSLRRLYLDPLRGERDGGESARETLRAYFRAGRNASSAAAALDVNRNTVATRLRGIEESLGRPLDSCAAELEVALRLEETQSLIPDAIR